MLRQLMCVSVAALALASCATTGKPPSCDGYSRRPLNRSLWDWERNVLVTPPVAGPSAPAVIPAPQPLIRKSDAGEQPHIGLVASYQSCGTGGGRHG